MTALFLGLGLAGAQNGALAGVRFVHLSPDAPLIDLLIDGVAVQKDMAFGGLTGYSWLSPGRHEVIVYPHRAPEASRPLDMLNLDNVLGNDDPEPPATLLEPFTVTITVEENRYYTVALAGFYTPPSSAPELGHLNLEIEPGTRVQVLGPRSYLSTLEQGQTLQNLEPGLYQVSARREGFEDVLYEVTVTSGETSSLGITLEDGNATSAPSASPETGAPVWHRAQLYFYEDSYETFPAPGRALLRVVHAMPGPAELELSVLEAEVGERSGLAPARLLVESLNFPNVTPYLSLDPGEQTIEVRLADTEFSLITLPADLLPGTLYTLYLSASVSEQALTPVPSVDAVLRVPLEPRQR